MTGAPRVARDLRRAALPAVALALLGLAAGCFSFGSPKPAAIRDAESTRGFELLEEEKWSYAMGAFREALEADSNHAPAHYGLGRVFSETGYADGAEKEFLRAIALDSAYGEAYLGLAALRYGLGRHAEAEADVVDAEKYGASDSPWALYLLGRFAERRGAYWDAEAKYRAALDGDPTDAEARFALVDLLMSRDRYDDALYELERERFPRGHEDEVRMRMAECRLHLGQDLEAERIFRQHAADHPYDTEPVWGLVVLALRRGDPVGTRERLTALATLVGPDEAKILQKLADSLASPDPFFVFLGVCREARSEATGAFRKHVEDMIRELVREDE